MDLGYGVSEASGDLSSAKLIYLLNADEGLGQGEATQLPENAFVIYQGHHGDAGAQRADLILPGAAYTEKSATYVNTEGRVQRTRAAVNPPGAAREDWKILRALSEVLGTPLPYEDAQGVRDRLIEVSPTFTSGPSSSLQSSSVEMTKVGQDAIRESASSSSVDGSAFSSAIRDFYQTDPISRASSTMARCSVSFGPSSKKEEASRVAA